MRKTLLLLFFCLLVPLAVKAEVLPGIDQARLKSIVEQSRGKVVMLNFFATWCPPCRVEIPELVMIRAAYPESAFTLIGLAVDEDPAPVQPFVQKAGVNYPVYLAGRDVSAAYGVTSVPHNVFYAKDGRMVISEPGVADAAILKRVIDGLLSQK